MMLTTQNSLSRSIESVRARTSSDVATPATVVADTLNLIETVQLVQTILDEAFPTTTFAIAITKKGQASHLTVDWTDGPRDLQVARLVLPLQATRVVDGGKVKRVEHFMLTSAGRLTVHLAADRIILSRQFSDDAIERAIERLTIRYADFLAPDVRAAMTVDGYRAGRLQLLEIFGVHRTGSRRSGSNVQMDVDAMLAETTDAHGFPRSLTAARLFVRRDTH
ncbi:LPD29 domain-containing protein [Burkholderia cepacia]|uniref:LPD29 domain-containing protein n=1 Tax=Burkholderia cepacia TaxID=292 RepID=UPI00298FE68C|nr:LPD29 domain-containing protein [Burkholderia cepacia]